MFTSKREVSCAFCDWKGRRDKLTAHTTSKHPNEKPRTKDQGNLTTFIKRKIDEVTVQPTSPTPIAGSSSKHPASKLNQYQ